jgi:streptomycin 6-kinase
MNEFFQRLKQRKLVQWAVAYVAAALRWLEQDFADRDGSNINTIKVDPLLDSLHGDPRFEALVQKVLAHKS